MNKTLILSIMILSILNKINKYDIDKKVNFNWQNGASNSTNNFMKFFKEHFLYTLNTYKSNSNSKCKLVSSLNICLDNVIKNIPRPEYKSLNKIIEKNKK